MNRSLNKGGAEPNECEQSEVHTPREARVFGQEESPTRKLHGHNRKHNPRNLEHVKALELAIPVLVNERKTRVMNELDQPDEAAHEKC